VELHEQERSPAVRLQLRVMHRVFAERRGSTFIRYAVLVARAAKQRVIAAMSVRLVRASIRVFPRSWFFDVSITTPTQPELYRGEI